MPVLIDEVVDTYGGNYTYRLVEYEVEDGEICFYETYYGYDSSPMELVNDIQEIRDLMELMDEKALRNIKLKNILS